MAHTHRSSVKPWIPHASSALNPGVTAHPERTAMVDTFDSGRSRTTSSLRNSGVLDYWKSRGFEPEKACKVASSSLRETQLAYSAKSGPSTAHPAREMSERDKLKYMAQKSNIVFGHYNYASGREDLKIKAIPLPGQKEKTDIVALVTARRAESAHRQRPQSAHVSFA